MHKFVKFILSMFTIQLLWIYIYDIFKRLYVKIDGIHM